VSRLRARCPDCRTLTAVALGTDYQCHSCGREFVAAVVRVEGTPAVELPYPEAAVVAVDDPDLGGVLPARPIVLGGDGDFHARIRQALADPDAYLVVDDSAALSEPSRGEQPSGVGFTGAVAVPDNAAAIARFLSAIGLQPR
jgi:hypothetical protein